MPLPDPTDPLDPDVTVFEAERPRLTAVAARILGSTAEAEDVLQEAWLRLARTRGARAEPSSAGLTGPTGPTEVIEELPAWLTTVVTRLCLDQLRRRRTRVAAESGVADQLPSPVPGAVGDPADEVVLAARVGEAMQVVLDTLAPSERAAFVLHDVFGYPFDQVGAVLGRSATAARQLASRGRRKVQGTPEPELERAARVESTQVVEAFLTAAHGGELGTLLTLLAPDAVMRTDLVGQRMGTEVDYDGAAAVAARFDGVKGAAPALIDGELGGAWFLAKVVQVVFAFHVRDGLVREIELIADPEVLAGLEVTRRPRRPRTHR